MQLIDSLAARGLFTEAEKERANEALATSDKPPHVTLLEKGFLKEDVLMPALAEEFGLEYVDLANAVIEHSVLAGVPQKHVHRKSLMPITAPTSAPTVIASTGAHATAPCIA